MYKWLTLLSVLSAAVASGQPVWTWTDESGQVHYSDRPMPGAREIELRGAQAVQMDRPAPEIPTPAEQPPTPAQPYRALQVLNPAPQETLRNTGGDLAVELLLEPPALRSGHRLDLYLDGQRLNLNATSTRLTVTEIWRGEHTLQAVVLNAQGAELLRSAPVTFFVQQTSVQNPHNPNAPSNRPRPSP